MQEKLQQIESIEQELISLSHAATRRWQRVASLMIQVDIEKLWFGKTSSFSGWVRKLASKAGLHESNYWRALKAGRYYISLANRHTHLPLLDNAEIPAESLELVEKIGRYTNEDTALELTTGLLRGEMSRDTLRGYWQECRGYQLEKEHVGKATEPLFIHALREQSNQLKSRHNIISLTLQNQWHTIMQPLELEHYWLERSCQIQQYRVDAVMIYSDASDKLCFDACIFATEKYQLTPNNHVTKLAEFFHHVWYITIKELLDLTAQIDQRYGVIYYVTDDPSILLSVARPAIFHDAVATENILLTTTNILRQVLLRKKSNRTAVLH